LRRYSLNYHSISILENNQTQETYETIQTFFFSFGKDAVMMGRGGRYFGGDRQRGYHQADYFNENQTHITNLLRFDLLI
jgi:hypothetical protein